VTHGSGDRRSGWAASFALLSALTLFALAAPHAALADPVGIGMNGSCQLSNASGRASMTVTVTDTTNGSITNVTPSNLSGSSTGTATFFVQTAPRPLRELLAGKSAGFGWKGRFYGDGLLDVSLEVTGTASDGSAVTTGVVNCNRVSVGNAGSGNPPTPTQQVAAPTATNTRRATPTAAPPTPTRTPIPLRPTRTPHVNPTNTVGVPPTATRTSSSDRPTRTPIALRPTRTPIQQVPTPPLQATATRTRVLPTRTPLPATRTAIPVRPTRTPMPTMLVRPTRTPNNAPPTPTPTGSQTGGGGGLAAQCSLRRNGDVVTVTMLVENRSGVDVTAVRGSSLLLEPEGGALLFDRTGPSPGSVSKLRNGASTSFQWTGRLSASGTMGFSAFAAASSQNGPLQTAAIDCGVTSSDPSGSTAPDPPQFTGDCSIQPGQNGQITVEVSNGSNETLLNVDASFVSTSGQGTAQALNVRGPAPRTISTLPAGVRRDFIFGANFDGSGQVTMQFKATAVRPNDQGISTGTISCSGNVGGQAGDLPDLGVDSADLQSSVEIQTQNFTAQSCAVAEGCVDGVGPRTLLRFNTVTPNFGPGDVFLGNPVGNPNFIWSPCHMHYHFTEYADYRLLDMSGNIVARGHKQAFCLVDLWKPPGLGGDANPQFTNCGFQGISAGWADVYDRSLDCQWIDITGVPSGRYVLQVEINPAHVIQENNYNNNTGQAEVTIP
jgi:hypothetical protein